MLTQNKCYILENVQQFPNINPNIIGLSSLQCFMDSLR